MITSDVPKCLDASGDPGERGYNDLGQCENDATHEAQHPDGLWSAYCHRCAKYWRTHRKLTRARLISHFWVQTRPGERLTTGQPNANLQPPGRGQL